MKVVEVHLEDLRAKIGESIAASTVWDYGLCGRFIVRNLNKEVCSVFDLTGFNRLLNIE